MTALALLRRVRLPALRRALSGAQGQQVMQWVSLGVLAVAVMAGIFGVSFFTFSALLGIEGGARIGEIALATVFTTTAIVEVFFGMTTAVYTLYLARDLPVLATMPIPDRAIFAYKFWETLAGNAMLFCVLALPFLLAYGLASGAGLLYYPTVFLVSVLVLMIPTGLTILLVMPVMRVLPGSRAKEVVALVWTLGGVALWLGYNVLLQRGPRPDSAPDLRTLLDRPELLAPPGGWASDALLGASALDWGGLLSGLLPLAAVALLAYAVCLALVPAAYAGGWARVAEGGGRVRGGVAARLFGWLPADLRAVVVKDLTALPRDLRQLAGVGTTAVMGVVLTVLNRPGGDLAGAGPLGELLPYLAVGALGGVGAAQSATQAIGGEGKAYWMIVAAPIPAGRVLLAKWIGAFCVGLVAASVGLMAVSFLAFSPAGLLAGLGAGALVAAAISTYSVGVSASFPRFDWENPRYATSTAGGFILALGILWLFFVTAAAAGGVFLLSTQVPVWAALPAGALAWLLGAAIPGAGLLALGHRRLSRLEWEL